MDFFQTCVSKPRFPHTSFGEAQVIYPAWATLANIFRVAPLILPAATCNTTMIQHSVSGRYMPGAHTLAPSSFDLSPANWPPTQHSATKCSVRDASTWATPCPSALLQKMAALQHGMAAGGRGARLLLRGDIGALGLSYLGRFLFVCLFNVSLKTKVVRQVPENAIMHGNFIWVYLVSWGRGDIVKECLWKK